MKRLFGVLLALIIMLTCAGCGGGDKPADKPAAPAANEQQSSKAGALMPIGLDEAGYKRWTENVAQSEGRPAGYAAPNTVVFFDDMNSMVLALKNSQIDRFATCKVVGGYIVARNDDLKLVDDNYKPILGFSMAMEEKSAAQVEEINAAIKAMREDGTLQKLVQENIIDLGGKDPVAKPIPVIEGAATIKVGVTGDLPPLDFVTADGKPAGFNTAMLAEVSKLIGKNFELVQIDSGARAVALTSKEVDVVFWVAVPLNDTLAPPDCDKPEGVILTEPYFTDEITHVALKK